MSTKRVIRLKELKAKTGLSAFPLYQFSNPDYPHYDPSFPKPIRLGERSIGWIESEVDAWIDSRPRDRCETGFRIGKDTKGKASRESASSGEEV